ncbi:MAG TPA: glycoside hydrolase family 43 protein, partial [Blastocatellia bacterium]|nr:glycoside hydrolase family 43 protein [Blastocatellia bacterium]
MKQQGDAEERRGYRRDRAVAPRAACCLLLLFVSAAGLTAQTGAYVNPVFDTDFPDPTVILASDGWFYAYATQTILDGRSQNIQVARSKDLVRWERMPDAMPVKPRWASRTQQFWAPDVHQRGDTFYMYYSAVLNPDLAEQFKRENRVETSREAVFCLGVATSSAPGGPFDDSGRPLSCSLSFVNIDPMAFDDPKTGKKYLYWGSGFQPIKVQELSDDRLSFKPGSRPVDLIKPDKNVAYQTLVEGAWVIERGGYYYLFYSGENCCQGPPPQIKYAVMVARSHSPLGPFETLAEATGRSDSVILKRNETWLAPGHNSVVTDAEGQDWIVYHAISSRHPFQTGEVG